MNSKAWYCAAVAFCLGLLACQSDSEVPEGASTEVVFRVVNYTQYSLDELTRASAEVLDHLVLGVFDADTDVPVGSLTVQNEGDSDYGTFSVRLTKGQYRLVFLGYDGKNACSMTSSSVLSFTDDFVPHTFIYSTLLTVGEDAVPAQDIVLKRAVGAFRLTPTDAEMPSDWTKMRFSFAGGSTKLNVQTGFGVDNAGRIYDISIPSDFQTRKDRFMTVFLFIPEGEAPMDITVDALNSKGEVIHSRKFPAVPMKVNQLLNYTGEFFADPTSELSATVTYDIKWGSEQTVNF